MVSQRAVLGAMLSVLIAAVVIVVVGAWIGHNGLFQVGADTVKYVFGAVIGALASAFSRSGSQPEATGGQNQTKQK